MTAASDKHFPLCRNRHRGEQGLGASQLIFWPVVACENDSRADTACGITSTLVIDVGTQNLSGIRYLMLGLSTMLERMADQTTIQVRRIVHPEQLLHALSGSI